MSNALKWGAIAVVGWLVWSAVAKTYETGGPDLASSGEAVLGRGWAAPLTQRNDVYAWAPPNGIPRQ